MSPDDPNPSDDGGERYAATLCEVGVAAGLDRVGVAAAVPFDRARRAIEERKARGLDGGMQFTFRNPARATDPGRLLPGAASLVVGARAYPAELPPRPGSGPYGRVARYATTDRYAPLRRALDAVAAQLRRDGWHTRVLVDDNALVDREAAYRAGLGWYGKSANLLMPGAGSWFLLGSVLTDAPLPATPAPLADGCGACRRCLDGCPTGAIVAPGVVDARRCLAWLVQAEGDLPRDHRVALGDRLYGCDECQEVCPPNRRAGEARAAEDTGESWVDLLALLDEGDDALLEHFGRWYVPHREPRYLRRNALVALGNTADPDDARVEARLRHYLGHSDPMLRRHAVWAAGRLGRLDLLANRRDDSDPGVREELAAVGALP